MGGCRGPGRGGGAAVEEVTFSPVARDAITPELLSIFLPAFDGNPGGIIDIAAQIEAGAILYVVSYGAPRYPVGYFVARMDGVEYEILAAVSTGSASLLDDMAQQFIAAARYAGARAVKFDTWRPGLMRGMRRHGWRGIAVRMWREV